MNVENLNSNNSKNISTKIPENMKALIDKECAKHNISIAQYTRIGFWYLLREKEEFVNYVANAKIAHITKGIENEKTQTINGFKIYFDRFEITNDDINLYVNFYASNDLLIVSKKLPIMSIDFKVED